MDLTFLVRLLILVLVLGVVAGIEYLRLKERANRWREYLFLLACGTFGAIFGAAFDQLSVTLSPEYFEIAKDIARDDAFRFNVTMLGMHAGFFMGAITACALLVCRRGVPLRQLARALPWVPGLALLAAPLGMLVLLLLDPSIERVPPDARAGFLRVMGLHYGLYAGAIAGMVVAVRKGRRGRWERRLPEPQGTALDEDDLTA